MHIGIWMGPGFWEGGCTFWITDVRNLTFCVLRTGAPKLPVSHGLAADLGPSQGLNDVGC